MGTGRVTKKMLRKGSLVKKRQDSLEHTVHTPDKHRHRRRDGDERPHGQPKQGFEKKKQRHQTACDANHKNVCHMAGINGVGGSSLTQVRQSQNGKREKKRDPCPIGHEDENNRNNHRRIQSPDKSFMVFFLVAQKHWNARAPGCF